MITFRKSIRFIGLVKVILCTFQMDAIDSSGLVIPVSVWVKKLPSSPSVSEQVADVAGCEVSSEPRCLVIMEPVERTTANITFDSTVSSEKTQTVGVTY